ncbi:SDR family oxidoreductase [Acuticoccus sediminis]|uniref:SDR family oxidoreductase n=1 Tax=Acuticoccus sediminis TaxID=2184697 RepID=UPI001CFEAECC|nr:SDR family oxidoreductase [Acuticoccus sediminis]
MRGTERFSLAGRTALVTGASRGIGQAIAVGLAEAGADVVAVARSADGLAETRARIEKLHRTCHAIAADVTRPDAFAAHLEALAVTGIVPTILVNNAGVEEVAPSTDVSEALWEKIVGTNLKAAFFVAQAFARPLLADERPGAIINLGSLTSAVGIPTATPYTASKSGILGMTRALAAEWAPTIRVNAIGPGYFRTAMTEGFYKSRNWQAAMLGKIPMRRFGELDDLVGVSVFLASEASAYMTGQIVYVDGGTLAAL